MTLFKKTIPASIHKMFKRDIILLKFPPGKSITEQELSKYYKVSRTPVRQVIQTLINERFIIYKRGSGNIIAPMSWDDYLHVYQIRMGLEQLSMQLAILHADDETLKAIEDNIDEQRKIVIDDLYPRRFLELDREFHLLIAQAGKNDRLFGMLSNIYDHYARYDLFSGYCRRLQIAINEHLDIFNALKNMNNGLASILMRSHLESAHNILCHDLPEKL